ncbi:uncharacterized protein LOC128997520 [Macrosteles quadrilineatus]|uniref:uncharacterized protein LOC128997520 n=1 Tax=Macrosteles quadrilineatus TaxID=74068 RepID=UPI0023E2EB3F|nr:uncharacterized protein LOC128997520 [Macrosteles quadrilineatus]
MSTHTMLLKDKPISKLWELDVIGIEDPNSRKNKIEEEVEATEFFNKSVQINDDGRYEVPLLWREGHPPLPTNVNIAVKRLESTVKKLQEKKTYDVYDAAFKEWEQEGIIEEVPYTADFGKLGHYLPHHPVYKENSTTKVRPVFDASAKEYNNLH